jgi:hypothetical protein
MAAALLARLGAEALRPQFVNGSWRKAAISAKNQARLRRETLLGGSPWIGDDINPPSDPPKRRKPKGHKHEREAVVRQQLILKNLRDMPQKIAEYKESRKLKEGSLLDRLTMTPKERRLKQRQ